MQVEHIPISCAPGFALGFWRHGEERYWLPRFVFQRTQMIKPRIKVGIFAGLHGDEPAAILGLIDFVKRLDENPMLGRDYQLWIYPFCNPTGYVDNTRHSRSGRDLNREFWKLSTEPEVGLIEQEIRRQQFDGIISLHSDDTSHGVYGFVRGCCLSKTPSPARASCTPRRPSLPTGRAISMDSTPWMASSTPLTMAFFPRLPTPIQRRSKSSSKHRNSLHWICSARPLCSPSNQSSPHYREMISFAANI